MGKSTISMVIFNSYVKLPEGMFHDQNLDCIPIQDTSCKSCRIVLSRPGLVCASHSVMMTALFFPLAKFLWVDLESVVVSMWRWLNAIWGDLHYITGWWFGTFFIFPNSWDDDPIWLINMFQRGWNHQPDCMTLSHIEDYWGTLW